MGRLLKKAQAGEDLFYLAVFLLGFGIIAVIGTMTYTSVQGSFQNNSIINSTIGMDAMNELEDVNNLWDYIFVMLLIGFALAMVILGYFIDVSSIFMWIYVIVLILVACVSFIIQYVWEVFASNASFSTIVVTRFPVTNHILLNLGLYVVIVGVMAMIATYAKNREMIR